ncbi:putative notchless protein -like protein [Capsicum annuum]|nr:putative notchless protein -like protein [Capsicum annuum]
MLQFKIPSCDLMKATLKYLAGIAGPSGYGSKTTAEQVTQICSVSFTSQLTAIITEEFQFHRMEQKSFSYPRATSGIGAETARVLAKRGVRLVIPARDLKKAAILKEAIKKQTPCADIILFEIDLSSFGAIQRFCAQFLSLGLPLHILINNAGKFSQKLEFSEDKYELTFATNYLEMLVDKMIETAEQTGIEGRIVNVSSVVHNWVKRDQFCFGQMLNPKSYNGTRAYAQSKLANILHAKELSRQLKGAASTCYVALNPQTRGVSGKYFADCNECHCSALANDEIEAHKLWKHTRALIHRR